MTSIDTRTHAALEAAIGHVAATAASAAARAVELLPGMVSSSTRPADRDVFRAAQSDLRTQMPTFCRAFEAGLRERVLRDVNPRSEPARQLANTNWKTLSLVGDDEVEEQLFSDRIGQTISHECEWELRELATYLGALLRVGRDDLYRNPLRPETIGAALYSAIESITPERETRKVLARELGPLTAKGMRLCYAEIIGDLKARGVQPVNLGVRGVEGPGNDRVTSGYASLPRDDGGPSGWSGGSFESSAGGRFDSARGASSRGGVSGTAPLSTQGGGRFADSGRTGGRGGGRRIADAEFMSLIRRLTYISSRPGGLGTVAAPASETPFGRATGVGTAYGGAGATLPGAAGGAGTSPLDNDLGGLRGEGLTGLMAVNLIRAHRDELRQASSGTLDHMVIDIVGSLFDQILSDSRVPPQMARQIARLQLPVLRVALSDPSFFSSRKHPVRRFVNRIASLACAFDDFSDGPGSQFLARVRELVQEIIEGDFDQVDVYAAKLGQLEFFIAQQTEGTVQANGDAASLLNTKETELRVQQRYMHQLQAALAAVAMQDYMRDFLTQVWSQALALAVRRDGPTAERTTRLRRAAIQLVVSVQPKGTPALRKAFLMELPGLMKTLHEGLAMIGWPTAAQADFFGKLLPAHAESLKGQGLSELDRNLLVKQLEAAFGMALPRADQLLPGEPALQIDAEALAPRFSADEAKQVGLVDESAVDWNGQVDIEIGDDSNEAIARGGASTEFGAPEPEVELDLGVDIDLSVHGADPAEPSQGPRLMDHLQVGFAYQMHLKEQWQKVRLSYVSTGRSFFVFTHGKRHQETLTLTARMLARMCDGGRMRAFESTYLLERATARARKQLAALKAAPVAP